MKQATALNVRLALRALREDFAELRRDESGVESVEYALLVALIVVFSIGAWASLRDGLGAGFDRSVAAVGGGGE